MEDIETVEYDGVVYEKRPISEGAFQTAKANTIRDDIKINVGDQLFFVDPRDSHVDETPHNQIVTVTGLPHPGGVEVEGYEFAFISCCFHRIIKLPGDINENDFNAVFE